MEKTYTVLELNSIVRDLIRIEFPDYIWVCGEIQGLRSDREKKHIYFELVEKHPEAQEIRAKVKAVLFSGYRYRIEKRIEEANSSFQLKNDIEARFLCEVNLHPPSGQYSLIIVDVDPIYTLGKLAQNRQRIIEELKRKGLLERNKQRDLPLLPLNIGLITAFDSAAYHDFIDELRKSGYGFKIFIYNSYMQGKQTEKDVLLALKYFNSLDKGKVDAVFITRGGGAKADLIWFDNKNIAEAIAYSKFPVFTALGHSIDVSIADIVAKQAFKTPTKGAQFLVEKVREVLERIEFIEKEIREKAKLLLEQRYNNLKSALFRIDSFVSRYFWRKSEDLLAKRFALRERIGKFFSNEKRELKEKFLQIEEKAKRRVEEERIRVRTGEEKIRLLDPSQVLKRGYSITFKEGRLVKSIFDLKEKDAIKTILIDGSCLSEVRGIKELRWRL